MGRFGNVFAGAAAILFAGSPTVQAAETPRPPARCAEPEFVARLASVGDRAELRFADGGAVRLADIRLAEGEAGQRGRAYLASLVGSELRGRSGAGDRWGTRTASALTSGGISIAELLVAEGYAVVDPGEADLLCDPRLLGIEATARERLLGGWRDAGVADGSDPGAVAARIGRFAVIEGRVVSVGERASRTYINLGRAGSDALSITLAKRRWAEWRRSRAVTAESLRGRRIRVRGTIERWRSPMLEIFAPDVLEIVAGPESERPSQP